MTLLPDSPSTYSRRLALGGGRRGHDVRRPGRWLVSRHPNAAPPITDASPRSGHFHPPLLLHKYGPNGMRLGLHCETVDMS